MNESCAVMIALSGIKSGWCCTLRPRSLLRGRCPKMDGYFP